MQIKLLLTKIQSSNTQHKHKNYQIGDTYSVLANTKLHECTSQVQPNCDEERTTRQYYIYTDLIIIQDSNLSTAMCTERAEETNLKQTFHKEAMKQQGRQRFHKEAMEPNFQET